MGYAGAHTAGENSRTIGACVMMNAEEHEPTEAAMYALRWLVLEAGSS